MLVSNKLTTFTTKPVEVASLPLKQKIEMQKEMECRAPDERTRKQG